jgi:hypothetical protein
MNPNELYELIEREVSYRRELAEAEELASPPDAEPWEDPSPDTPDA